MDSLNRLVKAEQQIGDFAYWFLTVLALAWPTYVLLS